MCELMFTRYQNHICACYYEQNRLTDFRLLSPENERGSSAILGNIYIAKVQTISKQLNAAFVEIQPNVACYYSMEQKHHVLASGQCTERISVGDEILVQVTQEAIKTKLPSAGSELSLTGNLTVVCYGSHGVSVSRKLPDDGVTRQRRACLKQELPESYGVILRTNAYEASVEDILDEFRHLLKRLKEIVERSRFHTVFSCLYHAQSGLASVVQDYNYDSLSRMITDLPDVLDELRTLLPARYQDKIEWFASDLQPLYAVYRLDRDWKEMTARHVWLKSGAYLVIDQTEAMTVIDVNTGKAEHKRKQEDFFLKVNLEAAEEIARQLRLRNLSGIILVDFIDMQEEDHKKELIRHLCGAIRRDRILTQYVDMTQLNLVELTRKKVRRPLAEQLSQIKELTKENH